MSDILLFEGNILVDQLFKDLPIQDVPFILNIGSCRFYVVCWTFHLRQRIILLEPSCLTLQHQHSNPVLRRQYYNLRVTAILGDPRDVATHRFDEAVGHNDAGAVMQTTD